MIDQIFDACAAIGASTYGALRGTTTAKIAATHVWQAMAGMVANAAKNASDQKAMLEMGGGVVYSLRMFYETWEEDGLERDAAMALTIAHSMTMAEYHRDAHAWLLVGQGGCA